MNSNQTLYEAILNWIEKYKKITLKPASYDRLLVSLSLLGKNSIATLEICDITAEVVQTYLNELVSQNYAYTTIKKQYNLISGYIKYANVTGEIEKPICNAVKLPSQMTVTKKQKEVIAYTKEEQDRIKSIINDLIAIDYFDSTSISALIILFMMETGTRVGEALALQWSDILWNKKAVSIHRTLVRLSNPKQMFVQNSAKSYSSKRIIPLSDNIINVLMNIEPKSIYVFGDTDPYSYEALRWNVRKICKAANVKFCGMHVFRHTFATNCYYKGCDIKILSKMLGHASISVTYNTYIHLFGDALEEMRNIICT